MKLITALILALITAPMAEKSIVGWCFKVNTDSTGTKFIRLKIMEESEDLYGILLLDDHSATVLTKVQVFLSLANFKMLNIDCPDGN